MGPYTVSRVTGVAAALFLSGQVVMTQAPASAPPQGKNTLVYIGTYTGPKAKGIYFFRLQSAGTDVFQNVTLVPLGLAADTPNASAIELDTKRRILFAASEIDEFEGKPSGAVSAFSIDHTGALTLINRRPSMGARPCHLTLDNEGGHLLVANCGSGNVAVIPVALDGTLGEAADVVSNAGAGTNGDRAHARTPCVTLDPGNRFAFVCDPASDTVRIYRFDARQGTLTPSEPAFLTVKPGAGPRQMQFRRDGRFAYVLNGRSSTIGVFAYDPATGGLNELQTVSTLPEYFDGPNAAGELYIHTSGKWLYASNAGHNSVVLFTVDQDAGTLTFVEEQGTGGRNPRQFGVEPSSRHLAISNRDSDTVLASRIDDENGRLKPSGIFADVPSPAAVRFLPPK